MVATARILRRVWQIYVAHVFLFTIFLAEISYVATRFENPLYTRGNGHHGFSQAAGRHHRPGAAAAIPPVNMDVLPLYIVLMLFLPHDPVADEVAGRRHAGAVGRCSMR